jgi:hypothetical protein
VSRKSRIPECGGGKNRQSLFFLFPTVWNFLRLGVFVHNLKVAVIVTIRASVSWSRVVRESGARPVIDDAVMGVVACTRMAGRVRDHSGRTVQWGLLHLIRSS